MKLPSRPIRAMAGCASVALALVLGGCSVGQERPDSLPSPRLSAVPLSPTAPTASSSTGPDLRRFYQQKLAWRPCRDGHECARLEVPLDYAAPDGKTISLAVLKVASPNPRQRIGSLVVNPGGPGASGVSYAANSATYFGAELRQAFDVVGFDPRGVGQSSPVQCLSDAELDVYVASDPDPDSTAERERSDVLLEEFGQGCVERSGDLAGHVSTVEAARDIDVLRSVLGDDRLTYFGASYGTFLGATYAELFPARVGRMVLDGAIDPSLSSVEMSLVQARGFETALRAYVGHCVDAGDCFLGATVDAGTRRIRSFLDEVDAQPIEGSGDRRLTIGHAVLGIWAPLYNTGYWSLLDNALRSGLAGEGAGLLTLSDAYTSRGPDGYVDNSLEALYAVNCLDHDDAIPSSRVPDYIPRFEQASPTFGAVFAYGLAGCSRWPISTGRQPEPIHAEGAAPILVVGTSRDPATPLAWAEALAAQLESGVLVRRDGDGHTGYHRGNVCVDDTVESYLISGTVPAGTRDC